MTLNKPNWSYWINLAEVAVEDAVCLSLDVSPSVLKSPDDGFVEVGLARLLRQFQLRFIERRDAARTHSKAGRLKTRFDQSERRFIVRLADFRQWGEALPAPFTFPEEFPGHPPEPVVVDAPAKSQSSPRNKNANLRIIAAMLALLRDDEGGRFPSDATVIDVLDQKYGAADGVSKRNLESVFAAAKRAVGDDLKPGKQRK